MQKLSAHAREESYKTDHDFVENVVVHALDNGVDHRFSRQFTVMVEGGGSWSSPDEARFDRLRANDGNARQTGELLELANAAKLFRLGLFEDGLVEILTFLVVFAG